MWSCSRAFAVFGPCFVKVTSVALRSVDGMVAEEWVCSDTATLFRQLSGGSAL
jgi:hypothetical protein